MKPLKILPILLGLVFAAGAGISSAQSTAADASPTRAQVKMERDEFLKSHRWDAGTENWVLKSGMEAPSGMKSRAEIKTERDEFLRNNRWDEASTSWVSLKAKPRDMGKMTREQVRSETAHFVRTHEWDETTQAWREKAPAKKK